MIFLLIPILTASAGQILFKKGMLELGNLDFSFSAIFYLISRIFKNKWLIVGIIFYGTSFFSYLFALSYLQLSIAYPVAVSFGIILVSLSSRFLFKESMTLYQILGIIIVIFGIAILANKWPSSPDFYHLLS